MTWRILEGDWMDVLKTIPDESVHCVVSSPPYWGLRDYGTAKWEGGDSNCDHRPPDEAGVTMKPSPGQREHAGRFAGPSCWKCGATRIDQQLGLERTPEEYVAKMVAGFREVRRVLRSDGTLWLNMGDSYAGSWGAQSRGNLNGEASSTLQGGSMLSARQILAHPHLESGTGSIKRTPGLKPKDLCGIPWMVAFALRADGWWLRQDIIWSKPNPMPESVTDRCTKGHEYLFLLTKSERYFYDSEAIKEPIAEATAPRAMRAQDSLDRADGVPGQSPHSLHLPRPHAAGVNSRMFQDRDPQRPSTRKVKIPGGWDRGEGAHGTIHREGRTSAEYQEAEVSMLRNKRSVWEIATSPFPEAHFATFPPKLVEPCIKAGCPEGGTVLDPFSGAGTTGLVATRLGRNYLGVELNPEYIAMASRRIEQDAPLFNLQEVTE